VDDLRKCLPERFRDNQRIVAVPNAVDVREFFPAEKLEAKAKVRAPNGMPLLLMLANLSPHKGQETAIKATALLMQSGTNVACWLAGTERDGKTEYTNRLQGLIRELGVADRVHLLGQRRDAADLLRAADFFLLPSTREGLPLSIVEAQATKVPVIAAPTAGIPEVVEGGRTGFLVPADDFAGYASRIATMLAEPDLVRQLTDAAHDQIIRGYTMRAYCDRMWELYQELVQTAPTTRRRGLFRSPQAKLRRTNQPTDAEVASLCP
jgi:glycosyltransferase involved in cell wall biosynthesis